MRGISCIAALVSAALLLHGAEEQREQGIAAFHAGRYSAAAQAFRAALAEHPKDDIARTFLALTEAATGDCSSALPVLTGAPRNPSSLSRLASLAAVKCYSREGKNNAAFQLLDELQKAYPNDADVLYLEAKLHMKAFNDATYQMFQRTPSSYRVHELSAEIFEVQHQYEDAAAEYRKAIAANVSAPDLHYRLGRAILLAKHDPDSLKKAAEEFRAELRLNPEDGACEFQLGQIAQAEGSKEEARSHFERALALAPEFEQALVALGKIEASEKKYPQAIAHLQRAVTLQPTNESAHYGLMTAYRDAGDLDKAKAEKDKLDQLQKPPSGEFTDFLKKLGEKQPEQR